MFRTAIQMERSRPGFLIRTPYPARGEERKRNTFAPGSSEVQTRVGRDDRATNSRPGGRGSRNDSGQPGEAVSPRPSSGARD